MTDKVKGFTVTLEKDMRIDDVELIMQSKHKTLLITIFSILTLVYVNLGLPYRVIHREERYCYVYSMV